VQGNLSTYLGFSQEDRIEHARRMGWMCDHVVEAGGVAIANFVCLTPVTREAFDLRDGADGGASYWAECALAKRRPSLDPQLPTALFIGRYQPFHAGRQKPIEEGLRRVGQACIAVCDTHGTDAENPLPFFTVKQWIETALSKH